MNSNKEFPYFLVDPGSEFKTNTKDLREIGYKLLDKLGDSDKFRLIPFSDETVKEMSGVILAYGKFESSCQGGIAFLHVYEVGEIILYIPENITENYTFAPTNPEEETFH